MIKNIVVIFLILSPVVGPSATRMVLQFPQDKLKQGSLQEGVLLVDSASRDGFALQSLEGQSLGGALYFHRLSPQIKEESSRMSSFDVSVIFLKKPEGDSLTIKENGKDWEISFPEVDIIPTEAGQSLIFENFTIPKKMRLIFGVGVIIGVFLLGYLGQVFYQKWRHKHKLRRYQRELKTQLLSGESYEDIVKIWQKKAFFQKELPQLENAFKKLERTLFLFQFKQAQTAQEKESVQKAYKDFVKEIQGELNGI